MIEHLVMTAGLPGRLASVRHINIPVLSLVNKAAMKAALFREMIAAIEQDHAHVLILGCTGIMGVAENLQQELLTSGYTVPV